MDSKKLKIKLVQTDDIKVSFKTQFAGYYTNADGSINKDKILNEIKHISGFILEARARLAKESGLSAARYVFLNGTLVIKKANPECNISPIFNDLTDILGATNE